MRVKIVLRHIIVKQAVVACLILLGFASVEAARVVDSVVKIIAGEHVGTGFVWQGVHGKYIATSLHTLAGANRIYYNKTLDRYELEVYKIDTESDLALLRAKSGSIDLPPLKLGSVEPVDDRKYWIYGFPAGVLTVQGDSLEFSRTVHNKPMRDYLDSEVVKKITAGGFPQASVKLLRVSSGITPGHSGAPIIDPKDNNSVIGIGAGGLSNVGFRRVNWAVPASTYLPNLEAQGSLESVAHMSQSEDDRKFSMSTETAAPPLETGQIKYYHIAQVPLEDLLESLIDESKDPEDQLMDPRRLEEIRKTAKKSRFNLSAPIDVYQNTQTGAMVFIPAVIKRKEISMEDDLLIAGTGRVQMYLQIARTGSFNSALLTKNGFIAILDEKYGIVDWRINPEWSDAVPYHNAVDGHWERSIFKYKPGDTEAEPLSEADIYFEIDYNDKAGYGNFLGVAVVGRDYDNFMQDDEELYFLVDTCAWVSGFVQN